LAIEQIIQTLRVQFERQHIEVNLETIGLDFTVSGDRQRIDGLLYNLLDNAMKYNYSVNPIVELLLKAENNFVKFIIKDNGIGIPEEYQNKIFDKFFRVPNGDIHNVKGHGLGLSFVAEVVKEMNGEIFVESQQSVGTTFIISFPLYKF
jgi:signal transduction histidine kinase